MNGRAERFLPYALAFFSSLCIMILELVASRLVARHVGASLTVWTSVIGIMLGGICLGNVLGGRLADRLDPTKAVGPLFGLGAAMSLATLWLNSIGPYIPEVEALPVFRTLALVTVTFLVPGTLLGMIGPAVAKIAVDQAKKTGTAVGSVYTMGAVGSIVGTFIAGFWLMYVLGTSTVVTVVAAALCLMSALLIGVPIGRVVGVIACALLAVSAVPQVAGAIPVKGLNVGGVIIGPLALAGHAATLVLAILSVGRLTRIRVPDPEPSEDQFAGDMATMTPKLSDLATLSFIASLGFMAFEMVAGRLVTRHLGSSIYGWTSIIGVLLGGLSLGNFLGGQIANKVKDEKQASWLFLACSVLVLSVLLLESPPAFLHKFTGAQGSVLSLAIYGLSGFGWGARVLIVVTIAFLLPSIALGTVSPIVAKLAVDRVQRTKKTGAAIGQVYAWGMVGSILGTFLTGFVLIDLLGTKGVILLLGAILAIAATVMGSTLHAIWAGVPLGLCVIAFFPVGMLADQGVRWGIREPVGTPATEKEDEIAWLDESDYYYIKVENNQVAEGQKRTLVLDNLIHGYYILGHPERLDYDYEHIYALVAHRVAKAKAAKEKKKADLSDAGLKTLFLGGGAYTFQRYMQHKYKGTDVDVAEIDPAVTKANHIALGLEENTSIKTTWGDARQFVERNQGKQKYDIVFGDAFNDFSVPWHLTTREFNQKLANLISDDGVYMINIIDLYKSDAKATAEAEKTMGKDASADAVEHAKKKSITAAHEYGGFLGSWIKTAQYEDPEFKKTFPYVYVFGTDEIPGGGLRETFVVVASKTKLDLDKLGERDDDPQFFQNDKLFQPKPYSESVMKELDVRSRGIVLTDDYAPVENLLAPVARTRGED